MGRIFLLALVVVVVITAISPSRPPTASPVVAPPKKPEVERQWQTKFDENDVACGVVGTRRWQIMFPTREESEEGAQPIVDNAPEDYVWAKACGPSDPGIVKLRGDLSETP